MQQRTTRVNPSEETIKVQHLQIISIMLPVPACIVHVGKLCDLTATL